MKQSYGVQNYSKQTNDNYEKSDWLVKNFKKKKLEYDSSNLYAQKVLSELKELSETLANLDPSKYTNSLKIR